MKTTLIILFLITFGYSCDFKKDFRKRNAYKGIITKKYIPPYSHEMYAFKVKTDSSEFEEIADFFSYSYEYAEVGDSIIKPSDTLMIIIKKDSTYRKFFYRL